MKEFFPEIESIKYEGRKSDNSLAFKHYNPRGKIGEKTMEEHLRFAVAYWHTFTWQGTDPFGQETMIRPWQTDRKDPVERAKIRARAAFEFMDKLGVPYFCFHDRDIAPEGKTLKETEEILDRVVDFITTLMEETGLKLLWGTANLFSHPRYMNGAATSPRADVFAHAAAQVKKALEITNQLGGQNYVFWGGREGYETLLNTDMALEQDNLARFLHMAADYAEQIGFEGQLLLEPKPKEPTKHQYDYDGAAVLAFLRKYDLEDVFELNVEANHATLAGHTFQHELHYARINDALGSIDANQGDLLLGWDTDQFPTNIYATTLAMYEVLQNGGLGSGGLNFDAKVRRASHRPIDLFYAHIAGMDAFARGLEVAHRMLADEVLEDFIDDRYSSYQQGIGAKIVGEEVGLSELAQYAHRQKEITVDSGQQERLEQVINSYLIEV